MANFTRPEFSPGQLLLLPGIALAVVGPQFDGLPKGLCLGAGIALILIGAFLVGAQLRSPGTDGNQMWLPSRDRSSAGPETDVDPGLDTGRGSSER